MSVVSRARLSHLAGCVVPQRSTYAASCPAFARAPAASDER
ncbi:hypothetical protein [Kribbella sp. NPDC000426]